MHLKSTCGQPAAGLRHPTEMVVDELRVAPLGAEPEGGPSAWLAAGAPPAGWDAETGTPTEISRTARRFGSVVVDSAESADAAIRPDPEREASLLRPGGSLLVADAARTSSSALLRAVAERGLTVSTSRCGDFDAALDRLGTDARLADLGPRLVTHRFGPSELAEAFRTAASPESRKVLVVHP